MKKLIDFLGQMHLISLLDNKQM